MTWPFPPPGGPIPWTPAQEREYQQLQRDKLPAAPFEGDNMNRQHYKTNNAESRTEAALGLLLALVIGTGLAWLLISWWSS